MYQSQKVNVLLVDDNDDDLLMIQEAMCDNDHMKVLATLRDGHQAIDYLRREGIYAEAPAPDMIFLDINMPKMNGFEVLKAIRSDAQLRHIPVVMVSTSRSDNDVRRSYAEGACSYLSKPSDMKVFREMIEHLGRYWSRVSCLPTSLRNSPCASY